MTAKTRALVNVIACVALWGLIPVVARLGQSSLDNHQFLFWSSAVSFAVLLAVTAIAGRLGAVARWRGRDIGVLALLGMLGTYLYYLFLYLGYARARGMEVLVVQYTWPLIIVVLSTFLLGERISGRKLAAVAAGFAGVMLVLTRGKFDGIHLDNPGVIALVGAGAACFALFSVLGKRVRYEPFTATTMYFLTAMVAAFCSMLYFSGFALPSGREWFAVLLNGALVNGLSYVFWFAALGAAEASFVAPFTYLAPVLSALYLVLLFDEPFLPVYAVGLALVIAGGLVNSLGGSR